MEDDLIDSACIRRFAEIDLVTEDIPAATIILAFRHFPEQHHPGEKIFQAAGEHLREESPLLREGKDAYRRGQRLRADPLGVHHGRQRP